MMVMCFAPTCKHYSEKQTCKFFVFPTDPKELRRWSKLIRRKDRDPGIHSRICSCHFVDGDRKNGPTLFDYNIGKSVEMFEDTTQRKRKKVIAIDEPQPGSSGMQQMTPEEPLPGPSGLQQMQDNDSDTEDVQLVEDAAIIFSEESLMEPIVPEKVAEDVEHFQFGAMLDAENYFLKQQVEELTAQLRKMSVCFSFKHIEENPHLITVYTGLPSKEIFLSLFHLFDHLKLTYFRGWNVVRIPRVDQLLLTLMKLRLNLLNDDLGFRFGVSRETVSNIFKTWLFALHEILFQQLMKKIPSRNKNKLCMPASFSSFTNCRVILDCTEMSTIQPKSMEKQRVTYSAYKHKNTLKGLIGVAPNGVVTFVSSLYPGSTSDKKITQHCGITKNLVSGDLVLADKGFLIADVLPQGVSLNIPPFLTSPQFTREQIIRTRTIARARIHVERAIKRVKSYSILNMVPASLIPHASIVFQVCAALTNLQFPLIKEVAMKFDD